MDNQNDKPIYTQKELDAAIAKAIAPLLARIAELEARLNIDGTNSGTPTSQTPLGKSKVIPNSRIKSGKSIGGQRGHQKHGLNKFDDSEITETVVHAPGTCPDCGGDLIDCPIEAGDDIRDEADLEIKAVKRRHRFPKGYCPKCRRTHQERIPETLCAPNQYGAAVQALILMLVNFGFVSMARTAELVKGLSDGAIAPCPGYVSKLQKRAATSLVSFIETELKPEIRQLRIVFRDDTAIKVGKKRGAFRFYGDESFSLYTAHETKGKIGLDRDDILAHLGWGTVVMHDHERVNYREEYGFDNAECNAHAIRYLNKTAQNLGHAWAMELIGFLVDLNNVKKEGQSEFVMDRLVGCFLEILDRGWAEHDKEDPGKF